MLAARRRVGAHGHDDARAEAVAEPDERRRAREAAPRRRERQAGDAQRERALRPRARRWRARGRRHGPRFKACTCSLRYRYRTVQVLVCVLHTPGTVRSVCVCTEARTKFVSL